MILCVADPKMSNPPSSITDQQDCQHRDTVDASTGSPTVGQIGDGVHMFAWHLAEVRVPPLKEALKTTMCHGQVTWDEWLMADCGYPTIIGNPYIAHSDSLLVL